MRFLINVNKRVMHKCMHYTLNTEVLNFVGIVRRIASVKYKK